MLSAEFFVNNRQKLLDSMEEGSALLLFSGFPTIKSYDQHTAFMPCRNFYYFTGIKEQNAVLVLSKTKTAAAVNLFIEEPEEMLIKWNGRMLTREQACDISGLELKNVLYKHRMQEHVQRLLRPQNAGTVYVVLDRIQLSQPLNLPESFANEVKSKYPSVTVKNAMELIGPLRAIKQPCEIECLKKAIEITGGAFKAMIKNAKPGEYEYQWQADFEHHVMRSGAGFGFKSICASGKNAVMLHYSTNDCVAAGGDLMLFDFGAEYMGYSADISRTVPVNGRFTPRQKDLYKTVREALHIARDKMRPGEPYAAINQAVIDYYKKALRTLKVITEDSQIENYYYHGVSHHLGLNVHDPFSFDILQPGMVFTDEPGLYIAEEGVGVRLENDILITDGDPVDLAANVLIDPDELEAYMQG